MLLHYTLMLLMHYHAGIKRWVNCTHAGMHLVKRLKVCQENISPSSGHAATSQVEYMDSLFRNSVDQVTFLPLFSSPVLVHTCLCIFSFLFLVDRRGTWCGCCSPSDVLCFWAAYVLTTIVQSGYLSYYILPGNSNQSSLWPLSSTWHFPQNPVASVFCFLHHSLVCECKIVYRCFSVGVGTLWTMTSLGSGTDCLIIPTHGLNLDFPRIKQTLTTCTHFLMSTVPPIPQAYTCSLRYAAILVYLFRQC